MRSDPGVAGNCLRMAFHDAGTYSQTSDDGGANGSIMQELDFSAFPSHNGLSLCPTVITNVMTSVKAANSVCSGLTAADAIQVVGMAAAASRSAPVCSMLMGRPDKGAADTVTGRLPSECDSAADQLSRFTSQHGFRNPTQALVVLSGAHNIGTSRVTGRSSCSKGLGPLTNVTGPNSFDGHYYTEVVTGSGKGGWFSSDRNLAASGAATASLMTQFSSDHSAFLGLWCAAFREMSLLGVNPSPAGLSVDDGWDPTANLPNNRPPFNNNNSRPPAPAGFSRPPQGPNIRPPQAPIGNRPNRPTGGSMPPRPSGGPKPGPKIRKQAKL